MAYEKQTWISYDDNKTEEQNVKDGAVVTAERMNHIEDGVEAQATKIEFDAHLDDKENPHEVTAHQVGALTAEETSTNVIYQVLGKDITEITFTLNFKNKKTNSLVENPNKARASANNNLITPTTVLNDYSQERYNSVSEIDKNYMAIWLETANQRAQSLFEFAILEEVIRHLGVEFFELQGLTTLKDQTTFLRNKMTNIQSDIWGKGVSQKGNKFYYTTFDNRGNNWGSLVTNESNTVEKTSLIISQSDLENYLSDSGNMYFLAYSEPTDGTLATQLYIDYVELSFKLRVSTRDVIESIVATYYGENLGNVDNFETATQAEAESGTATDKFMTPLRTKQQVSSRIATQTEAEGGTATEKLMTPLRTKQLVDKRIATQAEAEAGTSETAIMTPKATKQAIEKIAANTSIARKSFTGVSTIETSERGKFNPDGAIISFKRTGNLVLFNAKLNHTGGMKWVTNIMSTGIPIGYRADKGFYETQFALPLNIEPPKQTGTTLKWSRYTIDDDNIFIYSDNTGNHFISGEWLTIDPFPEEDIV